jgi:DNA polymerase I-like protein with 3'-5' exonuclease and polymerase domains
MPHEDLITVDYETFGIVGNPVVTPPKAVGVAVWIPGREPQYLAWGHPTENNCRYGDARQFLYNIQESGNPRLFHNAPFDLSVQDHSMSLPHLWINQGWRLVHDTMYLLFLADPYAPTYSLKPSADRYLGMAPTEQDELKQWICSNVNGATPDNFGAFIALAPGDLVGKYAIGDVIRTRGLFDLLHAKIVADGMEAAYDRERELMPILVRGTKDGILLDRWKLEHHEKVYTEALARTTDQLVISLGCSHDDLDNDSRFADALERSGAVTEWVLTPKSGKRSMSKENLKISDPNISCLMTYKGSLETCLQTFMRPWLEKSAVDGRLHPNWNQVKQAKGDRFSKGTKTGRLSSDDPNFQNVPTEFIDRLGVPLPYPDGLVPFPLLREYCLPDEGFLWLKRDYSSQELRILAHFEDGSLAEAYRGNPDLDVHQTAVELIQNLVGLKYARKDIKITGFSIIYGSGYAGLASQLGQTVDAARGIKQAYLAVMPGINELLRDVKHRGERGDSIRTWGGRIYFAEIGEDGRNFAYRLLNYLIQGSAADQTKEAICQWQRTRNWRSQFLATVHDEINIQAPIDEWRMHMEDLRLAMEVDNLDVPIRSEGYVGTDWQHIVKEKDYADRPTTSVPFSLPGSQRDERAADNPN